jgi:hypothetical protein
MGAAQQNGAAQSLQQMLVAQYPPATPTPDGSDLVAAGAVLVLQKDNLLMRTAINNLIQMNGHGVASIPVSNTYANGVIKQSGLSGFLAKMAMSGPGANTQTDNHRFNSGEKLWVIKIEAATDGVVFTLLSDPINGQRYHGLLTFPIARNSAPPPEQILATVAEALKVDAESQPQDAADTSATADAAPDQPKTLAIGQTKSQVLTLFGQPTRVAQMGGKEIDFYPDMKVTFVNSKVVDINANTQ